MPFRLAILQSHPIQYVAPLFRRLAQDEDIDLTVYYCSRQGLEEYEDEGFGQKVKWDVPLLEGYHSQFLPNQGTADSSGSSVSLINFSIIRELQKGNFDAVWVHGHHYISDLLAMGAAKLWGIPIFMRCESHLQLQRSPLKRLLRKPILSLLYRKICAACLPIGTRNREFYLFHGVRRRHLFTVPYAVDNQFFRVTTREFRKTPLDIKTKYDLPKEKPLLLFASKLTERKRPMDLLQAFHRLRENGSDAALVFVGSGEEESKLRSYVREQGVPDVYFLGFCNQSELPAIYAACDVFVLPSENEPWGLVINEVMCAGLPVVACQEIGAVKDLVISGRNGFTFSAGDIESLTIHLRVLVEDNALRTQMGQESLNIICDWDFEACVQGVKAALSSTRRNLPKSRRTNA